MRHIMNRYCFISYTPTLFWDIKSILKQVFIDCLNILYESYAMVVGFIFILSTRSMLSPHLPLVKVKFTICCFVRDCRWVSADAKVLRIIQSSGPRFLTKSAIILIEDSFELVGTVPIWIKLIAALITEHPLCVYKKCKFGVQTDYRVCLIDSLSLTGYVYYWTDLNTTL